MENINVGILQNIVVQILEQKLWFAL